MFLKDITGVDLANSVKGCDNLGRFALHGRFAKYLGKLQRLDLLRSSAFFNYSNNGFFESNLQLLGLEELSVNLKPLIVPRYRVQTPLDWDGNIENILMQLKITLKKLKIFRAPISKPLELFLCTAEWKLLSELHLCGHVALNFDFLKFVPNLTKLVVDFDCFEYRETICTILQDVAMLNDLSYNKYLEDMVDNISPEFGENLFLCQNLNFLEIGYDFCVKSLQILGNWMPNLKKLRTILNVKTIAVVWDQWKELTELVCMLGSSLCMNCFFGTTIATRSKRRRCCCTGSILKFQGNAIFYNIYLSAPFLMRIMCFKNVVCFFIRPGSV